MQMHRYRETKYAIKTSCTKEYSTRLWRIRLVELVHTSGLAAIGHAISRGLQNTPPLANPYRVISSRVYKARKRRQRNQR